MTTIVASLYLWPSCEQQQLQGMDLWYRAVKYCGIFSMLQVRDTGTRSRRSQINSHAPEEHRLGLIENRASSRIKENRNFIAPTCKIASGKSGSSSRSHLYQLRASTLGPSRDGDHMYACVVINVVEVAAAAEVEVRV